MVYKKLTRIPTMPFLESSGNVLIIGTTLIDVQGNQFIHYNEVTASDAGMTKLLEATAAEAFYNSAERFPPPRCHPATRQRILSHIKTWSRALKDESPLTASNRILFLCGPVGSGKTAIAQTLSEEYGENGVLAASFFFARGRDRRGGIGHFVATIAYQLSISIPIIRDLIGMIIARDPSVLRQSTDVQFQKLIVDPFKSAFCGVPIISSQHPFLIIIDGLDECDNDNHQEVILYYTSALIYKHCLPLAFLFTSRPNPLMQDCVQTNSFLKLNPPYTIFLASSVKDTFTFLESGFHEIRRTHEIMATVSEPWPSAEEIKKLLYKSSGHFIYASTVLKFVGDENANPTERLALVLSEESAPLAELDELYNQILSTASNRALLRRATLSPSRKTKLPAIPDHFQSGSNHVRQSHQD
ncbi:hypothetical protein BDZ94DRAFT_1331893 [Collybia nuda]|uniref:NACHT domain-containing protein n=1 Tax=Collybia nuda TaxID=64659 RepID=A0A9P5XXI8_9AGAR|nr:hypothetical protein BDZ94DRAFT_1331893 [Collybia nuda]